MSAGYLACEAEQSERREYVDGEVYAMTGARDAHNRVAGNIYIALRDALRGTPCRTFMVDMKWHLAHLGVFVYPDVFVTCDERATAGTGTTGPCVLAVQMAYDGASKTRGQP